MGNKNINSCLYPYNSHSHKKTYGDDCDFEPVSKNSFEFLSVVGRGGFGKVWKVQNKKFLKIYAMKEMSKKKIIDKKSVASIKSERDLLSQIFHPFIVNMHYSFQDQDNLYLVMDFLQGGDLRYHLCKLRKFNEEQTKFFICCILLALEYIHSNNIIHRDLKPENLVLDEKGYIRLTDFGVALIYDRDKDNFKETSGTPGYMAPEVLSCQNHGPAVDFFALGVICYEMMMGFRPYNGRNRKEVKEKIMLKQVEIDRYLLPSGWTMEAADFINRLIQRKPTKRLGIKGVNEVKEHPWIKYFNWKDLYLGKITSPFIPKSTENYDNSYCTAPEKIGLQTRERYEKIVSDPKYKLAFKDYIYYDRNIEMVINNDSKMGKGIKGIIGGVSKTRNKGALHSRSNTCYTNPHLIYKILEDKEIKAFSTREETITKSLYDKHFSKVKGIPKTMHSRNKTTNVDSHFFSVSSTNWNKTAEDNQNTKNDNSSGRDEMERKKKTNHDEDTFETYRGNYRRMVNKMPQPQNRCVYNIN